MSNSDCDNIVTFGDLDRGDHFILPDGAGGEYTKDPPSPETSGQVAMNAYDRDGNSLYVSNDREVIPMSPDGGYHDQYGEDTIPGGQEANSHGRGRDSGGRDREWDKTVSKAMKSAEINKGHFPGDKDLSDASRKMIEKAAREGRFGSKDDGDGTSDPPGGHWWSSH